MGFPTAGGLVGHHRSKCEVKYLLLPFLLLLSCAAQAMAEASTAAASSDSRNSKLSPPRWAAERSADFVLNFTAADAAARRQEDGPIMFRSKELEGITHRKGYYYGNVAIVRFGTQMVIAVRKIQFHITPRTSVEDYPQSSDPKHKWISWWTSKMSLCTADPSTLQPLTCSNYDPRDWKECMWNGGFESLGPEDPRLIVWPGKGLFMMFVSKPWPINPDGTKPSDTQCAGPWAQQPWLIPLAATTNSGSSMAGSSDKQQQADPWTKGMIRLQYLPAELEGGHLPALQPQNKKEGSEGPVLHKQKNWNPFIYNNELYFSQSFAPHVVIKPNSDGACSVVHVTDGLVFKHLPAKPRGNTQAVLVPAALSGLDKSFFVGIVHVEVERQYTNYFYKMQAEPPFAMMAVSAPLPLKAGQHPRVPAWTHISFPMSLQLLEDTQQFMIGYGSGDQTSRVRMMPLEEALALFETSSSGVATSSSSSKDSSSRLEPPQQQLTAVAAATSSVFDTEKVKQQVKAGRPVDLSPSAKAAALAAVAAVEEALSLKSTDP